MSFTVIATFTSSHEAHLARARLEGEGIRCVVAEPNIHGAGWMGAGTVGSIVLEVDARDLAEAREILGDEPAARRAIDAPRACIHCGSDAVVPSGISWLLVVLSLGWLQPFADRVRCRDCGRSGRSSRRMEVSRAVAPGEPSP
jgi:hypothetical protein